MCSICGQNTLDNLAAVNAFSKLKEWKIEQAIEVGVVKPHLCTADKTAPISINYIKSILDRGGAVRYISMDEPYYGGLLTVGGQKCEGLVGDYTIETARNAANAQTWPVVDNSDGSIIIYHPSGGTLTVNRDGTVDANGFVGSGCTVASIIENTLGTTRETTFKPEFYALRERLRN